jgi:hypothetical protein
MSLTDMSREIEEGEENKSIGVFLNYQGRKAVAI